MLINLEPYLDVNRSEFTTLSGYKENSFKIVKEINNMKKEQIAAILYTILGCVVGFISYYLKSSSMIFLLVFGVYFCTLIPITKKVTVKKLGLWILSNTFMTYILVWLIVYILLSNAL